MKIGNTTLLDRLTWLANRGVVIILALFAVGVICNQLRKYHG